MDIRQLTTFRMLAHTLSFSRTAQTLNYVQSSVTTQIQGLEEELGVKLFDRLGKRVILTEAGRKLLHYAEKILGLVDEARHTLMEDENLSGSICISAPESLCTYRLPSVIQQFHARFPHSRLVFRPTQDQLKSLSEGEVDVAFVLDEPVRSTAFEVESLGYETLLMLAAPRHPLAAIEHIQSQDIQGEQFLLTEKGCMYRNVFERELRIAGIDAVTDLEFTSVEAIKQCTMSGMGITFLPRLTVEAELAQGQLAALQWEGHDFQILHQMLWHKEKWLSPTTRAFLEVAREMLTQEHFQHMTPDLPLAASF
ncbi:LysR family transcriptional regulator [Ktedonospora formicarum]|uniref:LysR family transcriptional regulator n=1 Tax=Ktedonospora formicarum TaxID=2778364 RepID=A0A8J3MP74_9CHLR|nr:LysR family transcriptional regulator [Ktedonospora formicarum]GHO42625.1 LysR family transcriptional regulator [Ktedonospora formicarum]